jgi:hypothetical protein
MSAKSLTSKATPGWPNWQGQKAFDPGFPQIDKKRHIWACFPLLAFSHT